MRILGIETSCDETAAAVVEIEEMKRLSEGATKLHVLSNVIASQIKIHAKTGGVVPEVAARAHVETIIPVVQRSLEEATKRLSDGAIKSKQKLNRLIARFTQSLDCIAVTAGPGLATSLLVGVEVARTLSWLWKKPLVAVNHLAGHVYANWLPSPQPSPTRGEGVKLVPSPSMGEGQGEDQLRFPILALIVSGGHTELVLMRKHLDFKVIGETRDDAAGEAFDKVAKMLGLGYPGGPAVSVLAERFRKVSPPPPQSSPLKGEEEKRNSPPLVGGVRGGEIRFPRPMITSPDFDFSFSGLKTAVLYWLRAKSKEQRAKPYALSPTLLAAVCHEFQEAVVDVLVAKTVRAAKKYKVMTVLLGGGVAANARLRQQLVEAIQRHVPSSVIRLPSLQYTTDNAAMIAAAGYFMARAKQFTPWQKLDVDPNWELGTKFNPLPR